MNFIPEPFKTGFDITNKKKHICPFTTIRPFDITHHIWLKEGELVRLNVPRKFLLIRSSEHSELHKCLGEGSIGMHIYLLYIAHDDLEK